jgi:Glyoxalase-like domain
LTSTLRMSSGRNGHPGPGTPAVHNDLRLEYVAVPELVRHAFLKVAEGKTVKNRVHLDVSPTDREQDEEVRRLLDLGARHADVGQTGEENWVTLADPEGNEFCVLAERRP